MEISNPLPFSRGVSDMSLFYLLHDDDGYQSTNSLPIYLSSLPPKKQTTHLPLSFKYGLKHSKSPQKRDIPFVNPRETH